VTASQAVVYTFSFPVVVLYISRPAAGLPMASRSVVVMRGSSSPFVVLLSSTRAEAFGADVVPKAVAPAKLFVVEEPDW